MTGPGFATPTARRVLVGFSLAMAATDLVLGLAGSPTTGWAGPWAGVAVPVVVDLSLLLAPRAPRLVAVVIVAGTALTALSPLWAPGLFVPEVQLSPATAPRAVSGFVVWLVLSRERRFWVPVVAVLTLLAARVWDPAWDLTPLGLLATLLPALGALYVDARRRLIRSLRDRAERAEREQHLLAERARAAERRRLAAEMHDVVTHRISLIVLHAGALGTTSEQPAVRAAAEDIRAAGGQALAELRDLVGVLRSESDDKGRGSADAPRRDGAAPVGHPAELAEESAAAGAPVADLDVEGSPDEVTPTVARTAYRVVQEALTNVRKHAPGSRVGVHVRYGPDRVSVRVRNSAATAPPDAALAGSGSGAGLAGLEQRVGLVGGTLEHGPTPDGGFRVDAILPAFVPTTGGAP